MKNKFYCVMASLLFLSNLVLGDESLSAQYLAQTHIVVASGFSSPQKPNADFFNYHQISEGNYLRVAHQYYGDLAKVTTFELDALAKSFLLREFSDRDWLLIFILERNGIAIIEGCRIVPIELYPRHILQGGRDSIVKYTTQKKQLHKFCE